MRDKIMLPYESEHTKLCRYNRQYLNRKPIKRRPQIEEKDIEDTTTQCKETWEIIKRIIQYTFAIKSHYPGNRKSRT